MGDQVEVVTSPCASDSTSNADWGGSVMSKKTDKTDPEMPALVEPDGAPPPPQSD